MCVIAAAHLLINLQLQFDAAPDTVQFRAHQDLCRTQPHGTSGSVPNTTSRHIRICAEHNLTAHQDLCRTQPHGTSGSVPNTTSRHIRICAKHNLTAHQDLCQTQPHCTSGSVPNTTSRHIRICAEHNLTPKAASQPEQNLVVSAWA